MKQPLAFLPHIVLFGSFAIAVAACGGRGAEMCELICDCENCNDRDREECEIEVNEAIDIADAYGCTDRADEFYDCALDNNDCDEDHFQIESKCQDEYEDLAECISDASALSGDDDDDSAGSGGGPIGGSGGGGGGGSGGGGGGGGGDEEW
jgi:uncharacterized membrane protein YgcG